jgi:uncharacterized OsmC-like protein
MSRDEIREKLQGAIDYLNANPSEARYTDSVAVARVVDPGGLKVAVEGPDGARITTDMPTSVGGTNTSVSPGWFLRAAEASCVATLISMRAAQQGIVLDGIEVTVDSESDDRGITGADDSVPAGPLSTRVAVRVRAESVDRATIENLVSWAVEHCPVTDAVKRAIPMTVEVETSAQ